MLFDENILNQTQDTKESFDLTIKKIIESSWKNIAPLWPLQNIIAVNPLKGFENIPFQEALKKSKIYFENDLLIKEFEDVNRETIKWLQAFYDEGQATIGIPCKKYGLFVSIYSLLEFDKNIIQSQEALVFYQRLKKSNNQNIYFIIQTCLSYLKISADEYENFITLLLTTLPGWSSYIQYLKSWQTCLDSKEYESLFEEYVALRLLIVSLISPDVALKAIEILKVSASELSLDTQLLQDMSQLENRYQDELCKKIKNSLDEKLLEQKKVKAQFVFCIDVRSEVVRKQLEEVGLYQTYGFAGFFGLPICIKNNQNQEKYASCPVLITPKSTVTIDFKDHAYKKSATNYYLMTRIYQSLKYNIITSFAVAEAIGLIAGLLIILRTFFSKLFLSLQGLVIQDTDLDDLRLSLDEISLSDQKIYALQALKMIGLTDNFAPVIVFCGHGSATENNAYRSALDCGACAGRHGGINGHILALILNKPEIRSYLQNEGISIPQETIFLGAEHITTTDDITIFSQDVTTLDSLLKEIRTDLVEVKKRLHALRAVDLDETSNIEKRSYDWAQVRPEWGLSRNASFIIGHRNFTKNIALEGRAFLHSYDWNIDPDGSLLQTIFSGPLIVTQWINAQYLFSTLDNVAFGSGSKITQNIAGKIGVTQGNMSDLMSGLPLQSVYTTDTKAYHLIQRLVVVVLAPRELIDTVLQSTPNISELLKNEWIYLICFDPINNQFYIKNTELIWEEKIN